MTETVDRVSHEIRQSHGDNVFRDEGGFIWVRQSEAIQMQAVAWDHCASSIRYESGEPVEVVGVINPYRIQASIHSDPKESDHD